jgi:hypothetical protein
MEAYPKFKNPKFKTPEEFENQYAAWVKYLTLTFHF